MPLQIFINTVYKKTAGNTIFDLGESIWPQITDTIKDKCFWNEFPNGTFAT